MCTTCGCGTDDVKIDGKAHAHGHDHGHGHDHSHDHQPAHSHAAGVPAERAVAVERDILAKNDAEANANRRRFTAKGIFALNLVSSPGSGKTTLLVETIKRLSGDLSLSVIEGDQQTSNDADRIRATGAKAVQVNTGKGCHLDAHMVGHALGHLDPADDSVTMIENVGNLVCPAAFDLGEAHKVVVLSVTEGEDKPLKYPDMFAAADLMLLNKCDLLPHLEFDADLCEANARRINPSIQVLRVSATKGDGLDAWIEWVRGGAREARARRQRSAASAGCGGACACAEAARS
ncbi:MAG: hydrogenase nickel incorporation protein HypB [Betaproteobacteria bacterium]|nr:hydrogenase nickel incorporation protein HypB [Betaproteobacteria bacterium]